MSSAFIWTHFHSSLPPEASVQSPVSGEGGTDSLCILQSLPDTHHEHCVYMGSFQHLQSQVSGLISSGSADFFFFHDAAEVGASYAHFLKSFFFNHK